MSEQTLTRAAVVTGGSRGIGRAVSNRISEATPLPSASFCAV